jgi:deoxyadenosine/deoxycytidine kinase
MNDYFVVISGCHGSGKSAVIDFLSKKNKWVKIEESTIPISKEEIKDGFKRQIWFFLNYRKRDLFSLKKEGVKLADRWANDAFIYTSALRKHELITQNEHDRIRDLFNSFDWKLPDLEIVLTANNKELLERIEKRKRSSKHELNEGDIEFIKTVNKLFIEYTKTNNGLRNVILLDTTNTDISQTAKNIEKIILNKLKNKIH